MSWPPSHPTRSMISDSSLFGGETTFVMKSWILFIGRSFYSESSKTIKCVTQNTNTFHKHKTYKINFPTIKIPHWGHKHSVSSCVLSCFFNLSYVSKPFGQVLQRCSDSSFFSSKSLIFIIKKSINGTPLNKICNFYKGLFNNLVLQSTSFSYCCCIFMLLFIYLLALKVSQIR